MNILNVNSSDTHGGAARAVFRLHQALCSERIDSKLLVNTKSSDDHTVLRPNSKLNRGLVKFRPPLDALPVALYKKRTKTLFSPAWLPFSNIVDRINDINPDIVHLHWINEGMLRIQDLARIKSPIVWSLHDNWAFTGGCHIMWECERYLETCGHCPLLNSDAQFDLSRILFSAKKNTYAKINNITIIGLSKWMASCASKSNLFRDKTVLNLPNLIDTSLFSPLKITTARELLRLPSTKKLVLFGAINATSDVNKGYHHLIDALKLIKNTNIELVVFGSREPINSPDFPFKTHYLGHLHDDLSLRALYSAADLLVVPSLQENLSNAIMESLACGTPVVAFNVGGNGDMIDHRNNGYLAQSFDIQDLAAGIDWILNAPNHLELARNARTKVLQEFDSQLVAKKYITMYESILSKT